MLHILFARLRNSRPDHAIIYGAHTPDWMEALGPDAPVWKRINATRKVTTTLLSGEKIPALPKSRVRTILIPLMENHVAACIRLCPKGYSLLAPEKRTLEILRDKARFAEFTRTYSFNQFCPQVFSSVESAHFPCVLKRTDLNAGAGIAVANSPSHLQELLQQDMWRDMPFILQQLISGLTEYVAHCVCREGKILWQCTYQYEVDPQNLIRQGMLKTTRVSLSKVQLKQIERILRALNYSGPCNIDLKLSEVGDVIIFEINPRLGGSLMRPENIDDLSAGLTCIIDTARPYRRGFSPFSTFLKDIARGARGRGVAGASL